MEINAKLSTSSINQAIKNIEWYQSYLQWKLEQFVSELADVGIEVIQDNIKVEYDGEVRNFGDSVTFQKDLVIGDDVVTCILLAQGQPYLKEWIGGSAMVNPLLMAEFGSGAFAVGAAQGTFPNQKNANKPPWFWRDTTGQMHMSYGNAPSRPLFKARLEMENQIRNVATKIFGGSTSTGS